jgi:hypothetical protein
MMSCPRCGSKNPARLQNHETGICINFKGCQERRFRRRVVEDRKRFGKGRWIQCLATIGRTSHRFCELGAEHPGPHLHGTQEWGAEKSTSNGGVSV